MNQSKPFSGSNGEESGAKFGFLFNLSHTLNVFNTKGDPFSDNPLLDFETQGPSDIFNAQRITQITILTITETYVHIGSGP